MALEHRKLEENTLATGNMLILPLFSTTLIKVDKNENIEVDMKRYCGMIGSLIYLKPTRPNICLMCTCVHILSIP